MGDELIVEVTDLSSGSHSQVELICDYCGKKFLQEWCTYIRLHNKTVIQNDCCGSPICTGMKSSDTLAEKYGVRNASLIPGVSEKKKVTNIKKYGVENPAMSSLIKAKIRDSNIIKYGVDHPMKLKETQNKVSNTCMERYGISCFLQKDYGSSALQGKNNPRWNNNITMANREKERRMPEYRTWRKSVFERDRYQCRRCGSKGIRYGAHCKSNGLNAHHIFNYSTHPELRYNKQNGITLCNVCHSQFHTKYGYHNNNKEQLNEFLGHDKKIC